LNDGTWNAHKHHAAGKCGWACRDVMTVHATPRSLHDVPKHSMPVHAPARISKFSPATVSSRRAAHLLRPARISSALLTVKAPPSSMFSSFTCR
jgi:hypothetical protein